MEIFILVLLVIGVCVVAEDERWKSADDPRWNFMENENNNKKLSQLENCNGQMNCQLDKIVFEDVDTKRNIDRYTLSNMHNDNTGFAYLPTYHQSTHYLCSCGRETRLIDLGVDYYPRYVSDMICVPGGCGKHSCKPKHFKLWVLRKRREDDVEPALEPVPFDLRKHWISENIITTIDCECI